MVAGSPEKRPRPSRLTSWEIVFCSVTMYDRGKQCARDRALYRERRGLGESPPARATTRSQANRLSYWELPGSMRATANGSQAGTGFREARPANEATARDFFWKM